MSSNPWGKELPFTEPKPWQVGNKLIGKEGPILMGILNLTPDSFFDGGKYDTLDSALGQCSKMIEEGADVIDIGAESSRPGAQSISEQDEIDRLNKFLPEIVKSFDVPISLDTIKSKVAQWGIDQGVQIINDVSGTNFDTNMLKVVSQSNVSIVINHMQGEPKSMQENPKYENVVEDVAEFLSHKVKTLNDLGVSKSSIAVDPGIGFGKTLQHNLTLLKNLEVLGAIGCPILLGVSRKSFIGKTNGLEHSERLHPTTAVNWFAALKGVSILRVHDVGPVKEGLIQLQAIMSSKTQD